MEERKGDTHIIWQTDGLNEATIIKYVQDQEKADIALDRLSTKEYEDPFGKPSQTKLL